MYAPKHLSFVCNIEQSHRKITLFHLFLSYKLAAFLKQLYHISSVHNCSVLAGELYLLKYHFLSSISLLTLVHFSSASSDLLASLRDNLWCFRLSCMLSALGGGFFCCFDLGYFFSRCPTIVLARSIQTFCD